MRELRIKVPRDELASIDTMEGLVAKMAEFTDSFKDKESSKTFNFVIKSASDEQITNLKTSIKNVRGVESVEILDIDNSSDKTVNLVLYKYANHWKYYEFFFTRIGVTKIVIEGSEYSPDRLGK